MKFIVADFSAIEARVLSFLANEKWRMDVFANMVTYIVSLHLLCLKFQLKSME
jgi:hypothetical protein